MSFNTNQGRNEYVATLGQTEFSATFKIFQESDLKVYLTPNGETPDDDTDLLLATAYTTVIVGDSGATITLNDATVAGDKITLVRSLTLDRETDYQDGGDLIADVLDADQNYQTYLIADQKDGNDRALRFPESTQGVDTALPAPVPQNYLRWKTDGTGLENDTTAPQFVTDAADSASAAAISESNAATSASNASTSETNALASENKANKWAEEAVDVEVEIGAYSAKHHATKASESAASIDPTNLLHTAGYGGTDPEGISTSNADEIKLGSLTIGESISITSVSNDGTNITLTVASHNAKVGDTIYVSGLNLGNGTFTVGSVTATTIVYASTALATTVTSALVKYGELSPINPIIKHLSTDNFMHVQDQKPSGTIGGASGTTTIQIRDLNTILTNTISGASLSTNQVTLPLGKYYIEASSPCKDVNGNRISINDGTSNILIGESSFFNNTYSIMGFAKVFGIIDLSSTTTIHIDHYTTSYSANGLGYAISDGNPEVYSDLKIWKVG